MANHDSYSDTFNDHTPLPIFRITCAARRAPDGLVRVLKHGEKVDDMERCGLSRATSTIHMAMILITSELGREASLFPYLNR
jgi:hypothetical protein